MQPVRVEQVNGGGWAFTAITAAVLLGAGYYTVVGWTGPVGTLGERIAVTAITVCAGLALPFGIHHIRRARRYARRRAEVLATGARTVATVTAVTQTNAGGEGRNPTVRITLRVTAPDGTTRSAWVRYELPIPMIVGLRPGTSLPVVLDLDDPLSAVVDWDGRRAGGEPAPPPSPRDH